MNTEPEGRGIQVPGKLKPAYFLLAAAVTMLILGLAWGGFGEVLAHGALVCLDCIGLF